MSVLFLVEDGKVKVWKMMGGNKILFFLYAILVGRIENFVGSSRKMNG